MSDLKMKDIAQLCGVSTLSLIHILLLSLMK